ncbi:cold shock domain-containing protein [Cognaticolwellia beringensis]|uniref:CSD domain-containing protein n=1 Tax=Cognaticolwellia beringensis TaxID=1967665 RepID=A0A222G5L6_9GAMM|nr:cold shock domain-containing protein [Cognaticolwellia beringensis]ASP47196.1 hypothetical protein B5D82_05140 [Cognaticolwellia beringensis]
MHKGQLKNWIDNKGFGFIESPELKQDTFIHISSLNNMSRKPKVGDYIYFEVEQQSNGKSRAVNCRIEGVATTALKQKSHRVYKTSPKSKSKIFLLFAVIGISTFAYQRLNIKTQQVPTQQYKAPVTEAIPAGQYTAPIKETMPQQQYKAPITETIPPRQVTKPKPSFSCDGRQHCSQMSSYDEAKYFLQNCPNTKMDGDRDGIPCERQFNRF